MFDRVILGRNRSRVVRAVLIPVSLLFLTGCGGAEGKEGLVEAYGYVTLDGEPLVNALVTFDHPQYAETFGRTDSSGYYEMAYTRSQEGAFAGENDVWFGTRDPEMHIEEIVPDQYLMKYSTTKVMIEEGEAPYDFDLTSELVSASASE